MQTPTVFVRIVIYCDFRVYYTGSILARTEALISVQPPGPYDDLHERMQSTGKLAPEVPLYGLLITSPHVTVLWTGLLLLRTENIFLVSQGMPYLYTVGNC